MISLTQGATIYHFNYNGDGTRLPQMIAHVPTTYPQDLAAPLPVVLNGEEIDWEARTVTYHHDTHASQFLSLWPAFVGK